MNTRYILNSLLVLCYSMLLVLTTACNNELEAVESEEQQLISTEDDMRAIQALGFDTLDLIKLKSGYLIQGDILIEKNSLSTSNQVQTRQAYHTTGLIGHPKQRSITVGVDNSIPTSGVDNWREEIQEAINLWNPLSNLKMTYTTAVNPDILIRSDVGNLLPDNVIAAGAWPMNGKPGSSIRINLDYNFNKTIPRLQKIYNMVHELGHCFGLRHTNWKSLGESEAKHVGISPDSDPYSVMNGGTAEYQWSGFSNGDKSAIAVLYPPFFKGYFIDYPDEVKHFGVDRYVIHVGGNHPIVSCNHWATAGMVLISTKDNSATVIFGSPVLSELSVGVTTVYGETYRIGREYATQITTQVPRN
ncbi:M57 family metalloprotease [Bacteroides sp.]|uniref:M57 family metalloprotease n=1 Tax=Bacteroides sp. TaxID=29523 RepID=UPI00260E7F89|nr:M57 family metalloprotease [Bacteroides sp.]